ncbi:MAG: hypothetical protein K0R17_2088 [Rariglobus sp.]|jgi:hypothetical protein|nr:hypothetical protein [Rariglobus sp.]
MRIMNPPFIVKGCLSFCVGVAGAGFHAHAADAFVVHEWGTFTTVSGSDGRLLSGLQVDEERLPNFVQAHSGFSPANKGWNRPVSNVTVKMETPVIYFYSDRERAVQVDVKFAGGSISQWYPGRSGGEELPPLPQEQPTLEQLRALSPVDFSRPFAGSVQWNVTVLAPDTTEKINCPVSWETPQWPRARVPGANLVKGPPGFVETGRPDFSATGPVVEGFLFYRGIGNFALPFDVTVAPDGTLTLRNTGTEDISRVWVYEKSSKPDASFHFWTGKLPAGGQQSVPLQPAGSFLGKSGFGASLIHAGLTSDETSALLATWKESYFDAPGLRVFWIVPRAFTDRILPIAITPAPDKLERVLVGRSEVLTPAFEKELVDGFRSDGGARWAKDRYFLAYRERARQLGVVLPDNTP